MPNLHFLKYMKLYLFSRFGADSPELLEECSEKECINSGILGMTLIIPMLLWFAGGWATAWMMRAPLVICAVAGGFCALVIALLDRGMMAYLSKKGRSALSLLARMLLAFAASLIFAHPAVFLLANGVIEREIESVQNQTIEARKKEIGPQLDRARQRVAGSIVALRQCANSAESAWKMKDEELKETRAQTGKWLKEADDEARGLRGSLPGEKANYNRAMAIVGESKKREAALVAELESAKRRLETAQADLRDASNKAASDPEIVRLELDLASASSAIRSQNLGDPFSQFEALHRLIAREWLEGRYSLGIAYIVVCVVLLGLELVPLFLKMGATRSEHGLRVEGLQFKAEQDLKNLQQVYPALSMELMQLKLRADAQKESLRLDHELIMDNIRSHRRLARSIMLEKAEVFEMAEQVMSRVPRKARPEHREFAERLAKQLIDGFLVSIESALKRVRPPDAGESSASAA